MDYKAKLLTHYEINWGIKGEECLLDKKIQNENENFRIFKFKPIPKREYWIYATIFTISKESETYREFHLLSLDENNGCIDILKALAYYYNTISPVNLWDTINFGIELTPNSKCTFGLISLPYLFGPNLEDFVVDNGIVKCYWIIPITESEVVFKKKNGIEALESNFENAQFDFLDTNRKAVV